MQSSLAPPEGEEAEPVPDVPGGARPSGGQGPHCLEFDSWWNEGRTRRCVYIRYNISEGAFQLAMDEDSNLYHVPIAYNPRNGEKVGVWDLHVGAEVDLLGRMTTLHNCSQTTSQWNQYWADRLLALRGKLLEELRKYDMRKIEPWVTFQKNKQTPGQRNMQAAGSADLRLLMTQVAGLSAQLKEYRPRLAAQLCVPKEMADIEDMPATRQPLPKQRVAAMESELGGGESRLEPAASEQA